MAVATTAIYSSLYSRTATDAAGSAVLALVGSVFDAGELGNLNGKTLPYLVWRDRGVAGESWSMRDVNASWFIYSAPRTDPRKLTAIADALDALYGTDPLAVTRGRLGITYRGPIFRDEALSLDGMEVRIGFKLLG